VSAPEADYYRLRTDWLRFKSQLFDSLTGLPALSAVMDDTRRLLETQGLLDVVYLDLGRSGGHETKLGWAAYDEAVREFASLLSSLRELGSLERHDLVCLHTVRSDRFLVFLGAGVGSRSPSARRERVVAAVKARMEAVRPSSALRSVRLAAGHARVFRDPLVRPERAILQGVAEAVLVSLVERESGDAVRREELSQMIFREDVRTVFHPIVRLNDRRVVGHEALTRPLGSVSFDSVEDLFSFAESTELLTEFERLCRRKAIHAAAGVPDRGLLFLNASAGAMEDPVWSGSAMEEALEGSDLTPADIVVEITERVAIVRHDDFQRALRTFKDRGYGVAVDDMGAGYASLQSLASIEPDFLKFDVSLVRDIDKSSIKRSLLESLRELAEKIHARVIAEGVERPEEMRTLLELGIELGQGFHFHREET
jgi:EAL domain-containing protein (putative c-di-GMP-specific phosphodiesterase class I)